MCSNNTSNKAGDNHHDHASFRKQPKKPRIPKRGPGVAELEKMLREEQEKISIGRISPSSFPLHRTTYLRPRPNSSPSSNSVSKTIPLFSDHSRPGGPPSTPVTTLPAGNVNVNENLKGSSQFRGVSGSRSKEVYICKAGIYLPEETLLPVTWGTYSYETSKGEETPTKDSDFSFPILVSKGLDQSKSAASPMFPNSPDPSHSSMMNKFPWSGTSSSSSSRSSSALGVYHEEPPSSQTSCHNYTSTLPEEDKMVGAKRPWSFSPFDNWPPAPSPALPRLTPPFYRHKHRLDPSSSSTDHDAFNLATSARDPMPSSSLELKLQKCVNDHGNPSGSGSSLKLGSPTTPLPSTGNCQPEFSKFNPFSFQEAKEREGSGQGWLLHQRPSSSSSAPEVSIQKKSFISILLDPEEQNDDSAEAEPTLSGLINEKFTEERAGFIDLDLNLKL